MVARKDKKEAEAKERIKMADKKMASKLDLAKAVKSCRVKDKAEDKKMMASAAKKDMIQDKKMMGNKVLKKAKGDKY